MEGVPFEEDDYELLEDALVEPDPEEDEVPWGCVISITRAAGTGNSTTWGRAASSRASITRNSRSGGRSCRTYRSEFAMREVFWQLGFVAG